VGGSQLDGALRWLDLLGRHLGGLLAGGLVGLGFAYAPAKRRTVVQAATVVGLAVLLLALVVLKSLELRRLSSVDGMADMQINLDGRRVRSEGNFHAEIAQLLDFGPYYPKNLDALWDRVSFDVERPLRLVWTHAGVSRKAMGKGDFERIVSILRRAEEHDRRREDDERFELVITE
jgi:ribonuclease inhibitor